MDTYNLRGVSSAKEDVHSAISGLDKGLYSKAFCKILPTHNPKEGMVLHADGAGTKSSLAYIYWKETGDLNVWKGIAQDAIVMNTDDMLCVGICNNFIISSTIGRNKYKIPGEVLKSLIEGAMEFYDKMNDFGIKIMNAGGETADIGDLVRTIIVDATALGYIPLNEVITNEKIKAGDVIVGLASSGKATYETEYNSGIGSNGLTNARHDLFSNIYATKYPESFDSQIPMDLVYKGKYLLTDIHNETGLTIGKLALSPTRTYLPVIQQVFKKDRDKISGMIHCSGGGQTKCLKFIENLHIIKDNLFNPPPIFQMIKECSSADWREMYQTFNMGHRLEIYCEEAIAKSIIEIAQNLDIEARIIGRCEAFEGKRLTLKVGNEEFVY